MTDKIELQARMDFWKSALIKKRAAYLALIDGGVKSYTIDDRQLTRFDIDTLRKEISEAERTVDKLTALLSGRKPRRSVGVVPRNW